MRKMADRRTLRGSIASREKQIPAIPLSYGIFLTHRLSTRQNPGIQGARRAADYVSSGAARLFTTLRTPSTDFAVFSASSFSARDKTVPVRVTTPLSAWTCTVFRGIAFVE